MKAQIVSFHCVLKNKLGQVLGSTFNHEVLTLNPGAAPDSMLKGLADGLQDLKKGEKRRIALPADKAYGFYDPLKVMEVSREELNISGRMLRLGDKVLYRMRGGEERTFRVAEIIGEKITLDANHPLAGQDLIFEIEATEAREATEEEMVLAEVRTEEALFH